MDMPYESEDQTYSDTVDMQALTLNALRVWVRENLNAAVVLRGKLTSTDPRIIRTTLAMLNDSEALIVASAAGTTLGRMALQVVRDA